jgi:hypothetical protein
MRHRGSTLSVRFAPDPFSRLCLNRRQLSARHRLTRSHGERLKADTRDLSAGTAGQPIHDVCRPSR